MIVWGVLAGGKGTRFGEPKATARFGAITFLEHTLEVVGSVVGTSDLVAVSVDSHGFPPVREPATPVPDLLDDPGPAHSIGQLAMFAAERDADLVVMAVDMLSVRPGTLRGLAEQIEADRTSGVERVVVARSNGRVHWVLSAIPRSLVAKIAADSDSVSAVQVLLRLCPVGYVDVPSGELLDVNTPDLLPSSAPISSKYRGTNSRPGEEEDGHPRNIGE